MKMLQISMKIFVHEFFVEMLLRLQKKHADGSETFANASHLLRKCFANASQETR
jgi:hypothetical protein